MRPVLFHIGSLPIYSYLAFVNLAFFACLVFAWLEARRQKLDTIYVIDLALITFIFGIMGARALFVIVSYPRYLADPLSIFKIWQGGLVYYGGLIGASIAIVVYLRIRKLRVDVWADLMAPTAMVTLIFGRIGCFLNGCCYGKVAPDLPWGVIYPASHPALGLAQVRVHPVPLYESIAVTAIFLFLVFLLRHKSRHGQVFAAMLMLYSAARFFLEFFRADPRGWVEWLGLSTSQTISVAGFAGGAAMALWLFKRGGRVEMVE